MTDHTKHVDEYAPGPALAVFWHRTRKTFVPLTIGEFEKKAGISHIVRARLVEKGFIKKEIPQDIPSAHNGYLDFHVLEITRTGKAALKRWLS